MPIASINPATGETLKTFPPLSPAELESKIALSSATFKSGRKTPFPDRARNLVRAAEILESEKHRFAELMTLEMGKTLESAVAEAAKCATACRYYAEHGAKLLADEMVSTNASRSFVRYQPLGPILAIMPWNFPFWQVFRFAAPALMAGNTGLLKHASNVPQCALAVEEILLRAGFPKGAFQTLLIGSDRVEGILNDDRVAAATLTGSEPAGRAVGSQAGKQIKKTVLELGGSDPFIVMPSADIKEAAATAVRARTINNGQSCIAAKRFIIADAVYPEFERRFVAGMQALKVGDPMDPTTEIGPLATEKILADLDEQVRRAVADGARLLTGGRRVNRPGNFYEPGVLADVNRKSPIFYEELFGPVAMLFRVRDASEAITIANDSPFGLGASVWTREEAERDRFIDEMETGMVFVNGMVASDARLPFGGVKCSGIGRELGTFGIREFVNVKTVWCA